jgi:hypothetical protein
VPIGREDAELEGGVAFVSRVMVQVLSWGKQKE